MANFRIFNLKVVKALKSISISNLAPIVTKWEGGFVNDPTDRGGATNMGVTINTWKLVGYDKDGDGDIDTNDIKLLSVADFEMVLKKYWNKWRADEITNQSIANLLVDWYWTSGKWGIVIPQRILSVDPDGAVGSMTIDKLNELIKTQPHKLFNDIYEARLKFFNDIVKNNPSQRKYLKGWKNRLADFKFKL